jgi:hypothetical protein
LANKVGKGGWKPGQSGNPKGKPRGSGEVQKLRAAIGKHVPKILEKLVAAAEGGDVQAARLVLERVIPPMKATEPTQRIPIAPKATLADQGRAVLAAVAAGQLAPGQGAQLLTAIGTLGKIVEIDELERRLAALEARNGGKA